jgi:predicted nucleotidyltransferase
VLSFPQVSEHHFQGEMRNPADRLTLYGERNAPAQEPPDHEEPVFLEVLGDALEAADRSRLPYLLVGGIASGIIGRPRWTHDVDLFVRPQDARPMLAALAEAGFRTEETDPVWLYKAFKHEVLVDIIFYGMGGIYLDDEMLAHACVREFKGHQVRIPSPEDLLVIKALVHKEETSRHWFDALAIISRCDLDWDYLLRRARRGARRVLSLLVYAQSNDVLVPNRVIQRLHQAIYEG